MKLSQQEEAEVVPQGEEAQEREVEKSKEEYIGHLVKKALRIHATVKDQRMKKEVTIPMRIICKRI